PPLPPPLPPRPRFDFGRRVWRHAHPAGPACTGVHLRSVLRFASGFFSTRPHGASSGVSRRQSLRAVASSSRLLPTRLAKDFHLQSSAHARHTSCISRRLKSVFPLPVFPQTSMVLPAALASLKNARKSLASSRHSSCASWAVERETGALVSLNRLGKSSSSSLRAVTGGLRMAMAIVPGNVAGGRQIWCR